VGHRHPCLRGGGRREQSAGASPTNLVSFYQNWPKMPRAESDSARPARDPALESDRAGGDFLQNCYQTEL
jgi:hypothetical protein